MRSSLIVMTNIEEGTELSRMSNPPHPGKILADTVLREADGMSLTSPHWWTRFQLEGGEVRLSTGTGNRREAEEFETVARTRAWRRVR